MLISVLLKAPNDGFHGVRRFNVHSMPMML